MALFNSTKSSMVGSGTTLPPGFDDTESEFFVPEEARTFYAAATINHHRLAESIDNITSNEARRLAESELGAAGPPGLAAADRMARNAHLDRLAARREQIVAELAVTRYPEFTALALHSLRRAAAEAALEKVEKKRLSDRRTRIAHTCPVCCGFDLKGGGEIKWRMLTQDTLANPGPTDHIRSCRKCWAVAARLYAATQAQEVMTDDGKTREALVQAHLAKAVS